MSDTRLSFKQLTDLTTRWMGVLGLAHWTIDVVVTEPENEGAYMEISRSENYDRAIIQVAPFMVKNGPVPPGNLYDTIDADHAERCLVHELMHCHTRDLKKVALGYTEDMIHRDAYAMLEQAWDSAEEGMVDRVAVALAYGASQRT